MSQDPQTMTRRQLIRHGAWFGAAVGFAVACKPASAGPLSGYLPLNLEPEMERQIERVLILADEPILKRPIPVELVRLAQALDLLLD